MLDGSHKQPDCMQKPVSVTTAQTKRMAINCSGWTKSVWSIEGNIWKDTRNWKFRLNYEPVWESANGRLSERGREASIFPTLSLPRTSHSTLHVSKSTPWGTCNTLVRFRSNPRAFLRGSHNLSPSAFIHVEWLSVTGPFKKIKKLWTCSSRAKTSFHWWKTNRRMLLAKRLYLPPVSQMGKNVSVSKVINAWGERDYERYRNREAVQSCRKCARATLTTIVYTKTCNDIVAWK